VVFTGFAFGDQLAALYQHAGVFVQPSALEGLPLTLLEAVSHDAPVLVSDIPPHLEVVGDGSSRHQVVPVDSVDALAGAVSLMLQHPRPRDAAARTLRASILDRHSWDTSVDALERLYLRTVTGRAVDAPPGAPSMPGDRHLPHRRAASA
jgi:glycosyltransferase involved in cell wall biosynthesis